MECDQTDLPCLSGLSHLPCQGKKENLLLAYNNIITATACTIIHIVQSLLIILTPLGAMSS